MCSVHISTSCTKFRLHLLFHGYDDNEWKLSNVLMLNVDGLHLGDSYELVGGILLVLTFLFDCLIYVEKLYNSDYS